MFPSVYFYSICCKRSSITPFAFRHLIYISSVLIFKLIQAALHYAFSLLVSSTLPGAVLVDQYCNPLADVTLNSISAQLDEIAEKVKKMLRIKNPSHPSLRIAQGELSKLAKRQMRSCFFGALSFCFPQMHQHLTLKARRHKLLFPAQFGEKKINTSICGAAVICTKSTFSLSD